MATKKPANSRTKRKAIGKAITISDSDSLRAQLFGLESKLDLHIQKTELHLTALAERAETHNTLLAEHAQRSEELKRNNDLIETALRAEILGERSPTPEKSLLGRIQCLESSGLSLKRMQGWVVTIGSLLAPVLVAMQIYKVIK